MHDAVQAVEGRFEAYHYRNPSRLGKGSVTAVAGTLRSIVDSSGLNVADSARLLALTSFAAADGQMTIDETKYHYDFWRPMTAIWEGDNNDGNPDTIGQPGWTPFVATPACPDYTSGANCLAASILTVQLFFGVDDLEFSVLSSVVGLTTNPRPYSRLSDAMQDVVEVRILHPLPVRR